MYTIHYSGFIFKQESPTETLSFPADEGNVFYREYLAWVADNNTADRILSPEEQLSQQAVSEDLNNDNQ